AACPAAEAVIVPSLILDFEGRRLFLVEGTQAPEHSALAVELHPAPDELDEVRASQDFFQQAFAVAQRPLLVPQRGGQSSDSASRSDSPGRSIPGFISGLSTALSLGRSPGRSPSGRHSAPSAPPSPCPCPSSSPRRLRR